MAGGAAGPNSQQDRVPVAVEAHVHDVEGVARRRALLPEAALAASIFHFGELTIARVKRELAARGIEMRPAGGDGEW